MKKGYTVAEVLIMLVVVGVIMSLTIITINMQKTNFAFSCYYLYRDMKNVLQQLVANSYSASLHSFSCKSISNDKTKYETEDVSEALARKEKYKECINAGLNDESNDNNEYLYNYAKDKDFCKALGEQFALASGKTHTNAINCTYFNNATLDNIYDTTNCNLILLNRARLYISKRQTSTLPSSYRIINVDVNGKTGPNTVDQDIISFVIFDNGLFLPLGLPAENKVKNYIHFISVIKVSNKKPYITTNSTKKEKYSERIKKGKASIFIVEDPITKEKKSLSFKDGYCRRYGISTTFPDYCRDYTYFSEKFKIYGNQSSSANQIPVSACSEPNQAARIQVLTNEDGQSYEYDPICEFALVKPQISRFIPAMNDTFSSKGVESIGIDDDPENKYFQINKQ